MSFASSVGSLAVYTPSLFISHNAFAFDWGQANEKGEAGCIVFSLSLALPTSAVGLNIN